jgi:hypothetical protein
LFGVQVFSCAASGARGQVIAWQRESFSLTRTLSACRCPASTVLDIEFQHLSPMLAGATGPRSDRHAMLNVQWNTVVLYPAGYLASK